jgi:hypothetical protein
MSLLKMALALVVFLAGGCNTPTIPIPPPQEEKITFTIDEPARTAVFAYDGEESYSDAWVYILNLTQGSHDTVQADPQGNVMSAPFEAVLDDQVDVTFRREDEFSSICVLLRPPPLTDADLCPGP